jgi:hypothetical protein
MICWVASLAALDMNPTRSTRAARLAAHPGPSDGICQGWGMPAGAPKTLFAGPVCVHSVSKAHPYGYGDNGKYGLDCSGFVRWVYALVYGQDVLGPGTTVQGPSARAASRSSEARRRSAVVARARGSRPSSVSRVQS